MDDPGMENGMIGMCVGEKRRLWIPPHFAYAAPKFDNNPKISHIARDRDVEYDVELVHIQRHAGTEIPDSVYGFITFVIIIVCPIVFCMGWNDSKRARRQKHQKQAWSKKGSNKKSN